MTDPLTPPAALGCITRIQCGEVLPFAREQTSAINKSSVDQVWVDSTGLQGDQQADRFFHGSALQAVHQMPKRVYPLLRSQYPHLIIHEGMLGENLICGDLDETGMCIGDVVQIGAVRLRLTRPRRPCWKIDVQLGARGISRFLQRQRCVGWYYQVLDAGFLQRGTSAHLIERPHPWATLDRLWQLNNRSDPPSALTGLPDPDEIHRWLHLDSLQKPFFQQLGQFAQGRLF